ncbi:MAG: hypothetical protein RL326_1068 [Pseudomonadota bacterium]|jgi:hypothetical protein
MFERIPPADPLRQLSCSEPAHLSVMREIINQGLLSPLSAPLSVSLTDGVHAESLSHAKLIIGEYLHLFGSSKETKRCEELILSAMRSTQGDFLLTLPSELCKHTAIAPHNPNVEMRPIGALGWKILVGDGITQPEVLRRIGAQSVHVGARLAFPLSPIPNMGGSSGFSASAAIHALRNSPLLSNQLQHPSESPASDLLVVTDHGRHHISCGLGFWVDMDVLHRDGHYAFAPKLYQPLPQHREQLYVDVRPITDTNTPVAQIGSPTIGTREITNDVRRIMAENFSRRSPQRKTKLSELV